MAGRMDSRLLSTVAQGIGRRVYLQPSESMTEAANAPRPTDAPDGPMPANPRWFSPPAFGLLNFSDLFTNRQLTALMTFSDLVAEARGRVAEDALLSGVPPAEAKSYAAGVSLYLAFAISKMADRGSTICSWVLQRDSVRNTFTRQAIPMTWDFVEMNMMLDGAGSYSGAVDWTVESLEGIGVGPSTAIPTATQADAASLTFPSRHPAISTDPPYYDNIGYADLSDFFYIWLRRSLGSAFTPVTDTMLTPKSEELVATPYRFNGNKTAAERHFENGFIKTFTRIRERQAADIPITIFYAFKQAESDETGTASTGWETMLNGLIDAGLSRASSRS